LEYGVEVDCVDKDLNTPLHVAASSEALDSIPLLLAYGACLDIKNKFGETALMIACKFGHLNTVRALIENHEANSGL
jgi:ankyrin repeat protein